MKSRESEIESRLRAMERLVNLFGLERQVYIFATSISAFLVVFASISLLVKLFLTQNLKLTPDVTGLLVLLFGSGGLNALTANRALRMWDQALAFLIENKSYKN